jgi:2-dehydro-3-deoxyphosphogluconate aldolase / (4S)-4-hydroxy-2-oxoglutarate aldolase
VTAGEVIAEIQRRKVIGVIRTDDPGRAVAAAEALARGGVRVVELIATSAGHAEAMRALAGRPDLLVGVGTVLSPYAARQAFDAGAAFVMSPHLDEEVLDIADRLGSLAIPGIFTATEAVAASQRAAVLKLFPAGAVGPGYLRALLAPLPALLVIPTGGVTADNAPDWFAAGAFAVAASTDLCPAALVEAADLAGIEARARRYASALALA